MASTIANGSYTGPPLPPPQLAGVPAAAAPAPAAAAAAPPAAAAPAAAAAAAPSGFKPMSPEDEMRYTGLFKSIDKDGDGMVQGGEVVQPFASFGIPREHLGKIWNLVVSNRRCRRGSCSRLLASVEQVCRQQAPCRASRRGPRGSSVNRTLYPSYT